MTARQSIQIKLSSASDPTFFIDDSIKQLSLFLKTRQISCEMKKKKIGSILEKLEKYSRSLQKKFEFQRNYWINLWEIECKLSLLWEMKEEIIGIWTSWIISWRMDFFEGWMDVEAV